MRFGWSFALPITFYLNPFWHPGTMHFALCSEYDKLNLRCTIVSSKRDNSKKERKMFRVSLVLVLIGFLTALFNSGLFFSSFILIDVILTILTTSQIAKGPSFVNFQDFSNGYVLIRVAAFFRIFTFNFPFTVLTIFDSKLVLKWCYEYF